MAPEPAWPDGHAWVTTLTVRMVWADGRWQVHPAFGPERDPDGVVCTHGLHLESKEARARCDTVRAQLDLESMPNAVGLARQLAARADLILAPEGVIHGHGYPEDRPGAAAGGDVADREVEAGQP